LKTGHCFVDAVEISHVSRVRGVLRALQPIAAITFAEPCVSPFGDAVAVHHQDIIARQWRGALFIFAHVGEDKAAQFPGGIPRMADVWRGLDGFGWTIDDLSSPVVTPTVVGATDTLFLNSSVFQRRSSMRTVPAQQRQPPREITKKHKLFSERLHGNGNVLYFLGESHGPPKTPQVIATECSRSDTHYFIPTKLARPDHCFLLR
jgi:hypothetical protein